MNPANTSSSSRIDESSSSNSSSISQHETMLAPLTASGYVGMAPVAAAWKDSASGAVASSGSRGKRVASDAGVPAGMGAAGGAGGAPSAAGPRTMGSAEINKAAVLARICELERMLEGMGADSEYCSTYYSKAAGGCICRWGVCEKHMRSVAPLPANLVPVNEYNLHIGELKGQMQILSNAGNTRRQLVEQLKRNETAETFFAADSGGGGGIDPTHARQVTCVFCEMCVVLHLVAGVDQGGVFCV